MKNFGLFPRLFLACNLLLPCLAQNPINLPPINVRGQVTSLGSDASGGTTRPVQYGTSLPGTCTVWQMFILTTATPGENVYLCTSSNTWTVLRMGGSENALTFTSPLSRATDTISLLGWGSGSRPVMAGALGTSGNCAQWGAAGLTDAGAPCGSGGGSGANALGYYLVNQAANAPANAINLGLLTSSLLKITVSGGVATVASAVAGTDFVTGADSRLTDARTPTGHQSSHLSTGTDPITAASTTVRGTVTTTTNTSSQVVSTDDTRMTNARTPTAHASSHQTGGSDEIATAVPASNAIPKAGAGGKLATGWVDYTGLVPSSRTVNGKPLSSDVVLTYADVGAAPAATVALPFVRAKEDCGLAVNGTSDDTAVLSSCISALPAGGGTIVFPVGISIIGNLTITRNNVKLVGQGLRTPWSEGGPIDNGSTQLKYPSTGTVGGFIIRFTGSGGYTNQGSGIERMTLNGNNRAATNLWLTDTFLFSSTNLAMDSNTGGYALVIDATGLTTVPRCGQGSGVIFFDNYYIWTGGNAGGILLGSDGNDVCSLKFGKGFIEWSGTPPYNGIRGVFLDSSTFADTTILELTSMTGSASCDGSTCTITTSAAHGMSVQRPIYMLQATETKLQGAFPTVILSPTTLLISNTAAAGTYTLGLIGGLSVELGTYNCINTDLNCAWSNTFDHLITGQGIYEYPQGSIGTGPWNTISHWNWVETGLPKAHASYTITSSAIDVRGAFWNIRFANGARMEPYKSIAGVAKAQGAWFTFTSKSVADYGVAIDFSAADPVTSIGYIPMRMYNNTYLATRNAANSSDMLLIGANTNNAIVLGSTFNPAGTRIIFANQPQLFSQAAPTCDATTRGTFNYLAGGGGVKDSVQICAKDASDVYAWRTIY